MSAELSNQVFESQLSKESDIIDDPDAPRIYTSEDEQDPSPERKRSKQGGQSDSYSHAIMPEDNIDASVTVEESRSSPKKPRLAVPPSLVSYAIDEDDDEATAPTDEEASDTEDVSSKVVDQPANNTSADSIMDTSASPVPTGDFPFISYNEPPTILSSDYPVHKEPIHVPSQSQLFNLATSTTTADTLTQPESPALSSQPELPKEYDQSQHVVSPEVELPPEPAGHCRMELQEKVEREVRRMRLDISYDPNRAIQDNKSFRNPSIYEKLISFLDIDERGTNFPPEIYNPYRWTQQSFYDELARVQNREIDRLMKLQKELKKPDSSQQVNSGSGSQDTGSKSVPGISSGSVATGFVEPKKRSKWDAGIPESNATNNAPTDTLKSTVPPVGGLVKQK